MFFFLFVAPDVLDAGTTVFFPYFFLVSPININSMPDSLIISSARGSRYGDLQIMVLMPALMSILVQIEQG